MKKLYFVFLILSLIACGSTDEVSTVNDVDTTTTTSAPPSTTVLDTNESTTTTEASIQYLFDVEKMNP